MRPFRNEFKFNFSSLLAARNMHGDNLLSGTPFGHRPGKATFLAAQSEVLANYTLIYVSST